MIRSSRRVIVLNSEPSGAGKAALASTPTASPELIVLSGYLISTDSTLSATFAATSSSEEPAVESPAALCQKRALGAQEFVAHESDLLWDRARCRSVPRLAEGGRGATPGATAGALQAGARAVSIGRGSEVPLALANIAAVAFVAPQRDAFSCASTVPRRLHFGGHPSHRLAAWAGIIGRPRTRSTRSD